MTIKRQSTEIDRGQENEPTALFRNALRFAGHALDCDEASYCRCGFGELEKALAQAQRENKPPLDDTLSLFRECAAEITGHRGESCVDRRCKCGAKKALRKLNIKSPDSNQFVSYWCSRCSREHHQEDLESFWKEKDALSVPLDSTIEALKESNREKCRMGNCPTKNCAGPVRRSILSLKRMIPDVPF